VKSATEEKLLEAGGSWTSGPVAAAPPAPEPEAEIEIDPTPAAPQPRKTSTASPREAFTAAQKLEGANRAGDAARAYRAIANGKDMWAALSLYSLADLHAKTEPATALAELDELVRRFPHHANGEDAAWLRVDVLRRMNRSDDAKHAAAAYLRAYPKGTYADAATRIASP
jgi:hypothetical protein